MNEPDVTSGESATARAIAVVEGPAFPLLVKLLASLLMAALLIWGVRVADDVMAASWSAGAATVLVLALTLVALCYWWILQSRTRIDATHIRQTWMWNKEVALDDVAHIKFIAVPYLCWLIAPRLVVRARGRGILVFHAADPRVLEDFARLALGIARKP